jgi:hypothetical protein
MYIKLWLLLADVAWSAYSTLKKEAVCSCEMSVNFYQTTYCQVRRLLTVTTVRISKSKKVFYGLFYKN